MSLIFLLREVVEKFPDLRKTITDKVTLTFVDIKSAKSTVGLSGSSASTVTRLQVCFNFPSNLFSKP